MTPTAYYDWWCYSGVCPGVPTRPANHAALREQLSAAGVNVIVLWELLLGNAEFDESSYIAPHGIFGSHKRIADAAAAVGATGLAEYLRTVPDAIVAPESHSELKKLLRGYASQHRADLEADVARHGDPRAAAGFDKRQARREHERLLTEDYRRYARSDRIPFFEQPLAKLRQLLHAGANVDEAGQADYDVGGLVAAIRYEFPSWSDEPQPPDVEAFLAECRQLADQYPAQLAPRMAGGFATPAAAAQVSEDPDVLEQLRAIGSYSAEKIGPITTIDWPLVDQLRNDLAPVGLRFAYQGAFPPALLGAWSAVRDRFPAVVAAMRHELLALAAGRVADPDLRPGDDELLHQVTGGMLTITADAVDPDTYQVECWWETDWDPEHGCTFAIVESSARRIE